MSLSLRPSLLALALLALFTCSGSASAFPGFYVGKNDEKRWAVQSQVVLVKKDGKTAVTVLADYGGPLEDFAVVLPIPPDVTLERVKTLRRDFMDRIDEVTAPRFHEFWEKDVCEAGPAEQIWEVSLVASSDTDFLGRGMSMGFSKEKVPKELLIKVEAEFKDTSGEYVFHIVGAGEDVGAWLAAKGYKPTDAQKKAAAKYSSQPMLVAEVQSNKLELVAGGRAQLSPIRWFTDTDLRSVPATLGRTSAKGMQDMIVFVMDVKDRWEIGNYDEVFPPTNLEVSFDVKERMGEFFAGLHDALLAKNPKAFLVEWVAPMSTCGEPCATSEMQLFEALSLGADAFEAYVPDVEKNPEVPEMTDEEKKKLDGKITEKIDAMELEASDAKKPKLSAAKKKQVERDMKKQEEARRIELARRKALISRHHYLITRLHHRYDDATLPSDPEIAPAKGHKSGGFDLPKGPKGELSREEKDSEASKFQSRYVFFHPWAGMKNCDKPERWRWGKPPRTYRDRRKIWTARELGTIDRKDFEMAKVINTPVPALGLTGAPDPVPEGGAADGGAKAAAAESEKKACGCRGPGRDRSSELLLGLLAVPFIRRRRR